MKQAMMRSFSSGVWIPITVHEPAKGMGKLDCGWFYFKDVAKEIKNTYIIPLWKYEGEWFESDDWCS